MSPVDLRVWQGEIAVTLQADEYRATFLPGCGMLCTSLQYRGEEYVAWPRSLAQYRSGHVSAIPLVHPWGNRLAEWGYGGAGKRIDLRGLDLAVDPNGLPIHGNLWCAPFEIAQLREGRLRAGFDFGADPERSAAFPFPHIVTVDARLTARGLRITTEIEPTGRARIPISFCWHPYLRLPEGRRRDWVLRWPACEHVEVDERTIPTGTRVPQRTQRADRRPSVRRPLRPRRRPPLFDLGRGPFADAEVRRRVSLRAAVRAAPPRVRRDRADDGDDRRTRHRQCAGVPTR